MANELMHHGVKGMKWGVRRAEKKAERLRLDEPNPKYSARQREHDRRVWGKPVPKRVNRYVNKGLTVKNARAKVMKQEAVKVAIATGAASIAVLLVPYLTMKRTEAFLSAEHNRGKEFLGPYLNNYGHLVVPGEVVDIASNAGKELLVRR